MPYGNTMTDQDTQTPATNSEYTVNSAALHLEEMFKQIDEGEENAIQDDEEKTENAVQETEIEASGESDEGQDDTEVSEEPEIDPEPGTQELAFESLNELAEAAEMKFEDFMDVVKTDVTVNGKTEAVNLKELRDGYQKHSDYRRKTTDLSEQRKAFESERVVAQKSIDDQAIQLNSLIDKAQQTLTADVQAINWEELRELDPGDYAAKKQDFLERQHSLGQIRQDAVTSFEKRLDEQKKKDDEAFKEFQSKEHNLLLDIIPEWKDSAKFQKESEAIQGYLKKSGFEDKDMSSLADHRIALLARKAMQFDAIQKNGSIAQKKVKTLPKLIKPGHKKSKGEINAGTRKVKMDRLRKTGKVDDAARYIFDILDEV